MTNHSARGNVAKSSHKNRDKNVAKSSHKKRDKNVVKCLQWEQDLRSSCFTIK